jgi:hypothetical protein
MSLLARLLDPQRKLKPLPPPHKSARVYSFAESVLLHRNAEQSRQQSRTFHQPNRSTA